VWVDDDEKDGDLSKESHAFTSFHTCMKYEAPHKHGSNLSHKQYE